jgi:hypothetical protein
VVSVGRRRGIGLVIERDRRLQPAADYVDGKAAFVVRSYIAPKRLPGAGSVPFPVHFGAQNPFGRADGRVVIAHRAQDRQPLIRCATHAHSLFRTLLAVADTTLG